MPDALTAAFDRLDDFVSVQRACGGPTLAAVELLQQAVGVEGEQRAVIAARAEALGVSAETLLLGVIVAKLAQ
jgi:uncharacterized tellurite resistance protein B-like protein